MTMRFLRMNWIEPLTATICKETSFQVQKLPRHTDDALERYKIYSTDWQDLMYQTAVSQDHQLAVNGGNN